MRKFKGHKPLRVIRAQCAACGVKLNTGRYRLGDDHVLLMSPGVRVHYNTTNGKFFGITPRGRLFDSSSALDGLPWFDALLRFFYYE